MTNISNINDIEQLEKSDLEKITASTLWNALDMAEQHCMQKFGTLEADELFEKNERLADRMCLINEELRHRLGVPSKRETEKISRLEKEINQLQKQVKLLKGHRHDSEQGEVTIPIEKINKD